MHPNPIHLGTFTGSALRRLPPISSYDRNRRAQHIAQGFLLGVVAALIAYGLSTTEAVLKLAAV